MATLEQKREIREKVNRLVADKFGGDYQKAFEHYDTGPKDGHVDAAELTLFLKDAGIGNWFTRDAWVEGIITELDSNHDGAISAAEFEAVLKHL
jgi:Ca2+-binding EF-hand superfamily protein